jgi:hypothetical protein
MNQQSFNLKAKVFVRSAIKQRKAILKQQAGKKPRLLVTNAIEMLERQLDYFAYDSDRKMANFIKGFQEQIFIILPGKGSTSHLKREAEFLELLYEAEKIKNECNVTV